MQQQYLVTPVGHGGKCKRVTLLPADGTSLRQKERVSIIFFFLTTYTQVIILGGSVKPFLKFNLIVILKCFNVLCLFYIVVSIVLL